MAVLSAAILFVAAGIFAGNTVTAWAYPNPATANDNSINVRESPVDGTVVGSLNSGNSVTVTDDIVGSDGQTWYQIEYTSAGGASITGWVRGDFLDVEEVVEETPTEEAETEEAPDLSQVNLQVSSGIPSDMIPVGFQLTTVVYEGTEISALVMNNADVYLVYMEDTAGIIDGRLVVYDIDRAELIPYISFETDNGFILLLNIPDSELSLLSDRFVSTSCEFTDGTMDALQMSMADTAISDTINISDYYFMYGVNRDGQYGWYVYNATEGTIQESILSMHYNFNGTVLTDEEEETESSMSSMSLILMIVVLAVLALLAVLAILFGVRCRRLTQEVKATKMAGNKHSKADKQESKSESRRRKSRKDEEEDVFADFDPVYYRQTTGTQGSSEQQPYQSTTPITEQTSFDQTAQSPYGQSESKSEDIDLDDDDLEFL